MEKFLIYVIHPDPVDGDPGDMVKTLLDEEATDPLGPLSVQSHHVIGDADLRGP